MLYAKVVFGLPVEGPFDYEVPETLSVKIKPGARITADFCNQKKTGYTVNLSSKTNIRKLKKISGLLDETPILNKEMLVLTKQISEYYCCSWGEAIELALPAALRAGKAVSFREESTSIPDISIKEPEKILIHCPDYQKRWEELYQPKIRETLDKNKPVIILLPDTSVLAQTAEWVKKYFKEEATVTYRNQPKELEKWLDIKQGLTRIVISTRSGIFAPFNRVGLIIIDEEQAYGYKQDQSPHYHARVAALMRAKTDNASLILGGTCPSLESFYLAKKNRISYQYTPLKTTSCEVKILDMKGLPLLSNRKNIILAKYLEDSIRQSIQAKEKTLLFINRLGFATTAICFNCGTILECERCESNLVFYFKENILRCHHCNYKLSPPQVCPKCNAGYLKYLGAGTEKIESELCRLYPEAKIERLEKQDNTTTLDADILIATQAVEKHSKLTFSTAAVLDIDNGLNKIDFRATEKTFFILSALFTQSAKKLIIQTNLTNHYVFKALAAKNPALFYKEELKQRKALNFPPYANFAQIKLRGQNEEKAESASISLFNELKKDTPKSMEVLSVGKPYPSKLRGNFYRQIILKGKSPVLISKFIKLRLKKFRHSGIIVTVDIDPE